MSITRTKEAIAVWHERAASDPVKPGEFTVTLNAVDLKALADNHTKMADAIRNWLHSYRGEFDESEDDDTVKALIAALDEAERD